MKSEAAAGSGVRAWSSKGLTGVELGLIITLGAIGPPWRVGVPAAPGTDAAPIPARPCGGCMTCGVGVIAFTGAG